jgi:hypothetical protein
MPRQPVGPPPEELASERKRALRDWLRDDPRRAVYDHRDWIRWEWDKFSDYWLDQHERGIKKASKTELGWYRAFRAWLTNRIEWDWRDNVDSTAKFRRPNEMPRERGKRAGEGDLANVISMVGGQR